MPGSKKTAPGEMRAPAVEGGEHQKMSPGDTLHIPPEDAASSDAGAGDADHLLYPQSEGVIGLISDTHGLLRDQALEALRGSELIIHAGDAGQPQILTQLRQLAPVIVVKGKIDKGAWASELPATAMKKLAPATTDVLHDIQELDLNPVAAGIQIIVSGHSKPSSSEKSASFTSTPAAPVRATFSIRRVTPGTPRSGCHALER